MVNIELTETNAQRLIVELDALGIAAHDAGLGAGGEPVSGWIFAHILHDLDLQLNDVKFVRDFGEDGGS